MSFNVNYSAGGVLDEVKKISSLLGGKLDSVDVIELVKKIELLEKIGLIERVESIGNIEGGILDAVKTVEEIQNILGGNLDNITNVDTIKRVDEIGKIVNFPQFSQPFNEMVKLNVPAMNGVHTLDYTTPNEPVEILALTVTCSGYGEEDYYNLYCNGEQWFKDWYCSEVKEGLFLGTSTFVYRTPPNTNFKLDFHNVSGTGKTLWFGIRTLTEHKLPQGQASPNDET